MVEEEQDNYMDQWELNIHKEKIKIYVLFEKKILFKIFNFKIKNTNKSLIKIKKN